MKPWRVTQPLREEPMWRDQRMQTSEWGDHRTEQRLTSLCYPRIRECTLWQCSPCPHSLPYVIVLWFFVLSFLTYDPEYPGASTSIWLILSMVHLKLCECLLWTSEAKWCIVLCLSVQHRTHSFPLTHCGIFHCHWLWSIWFMFSVPHILLVTTYCTCCILHSTLVDISAVIILSQFLV